MYIRRSPNPKIRDTAKKAAPYKIVNKKSKKILPMRPLKSLNGRETRS